MEPPRTVTTVILMKCGYVTIRLFAKRLAPSLLFANNRLVPALRHVLTRRALFGACCSRCVSQYIDPPTSHWWRESAMPAQILITPVPELFVLFRGPSEAGGSVDAECIHPLEASRALCGVFRGVLKYSTPTGSRGWARVGLGVPAAVFVVVIWPVGRRPRVYTANTRTLSTAGSCLSTGAVAEFPLRVHHDMQHLVV